MAKDADWPLSLEDPALALHFALEQDCPFAHPEKCPVQRQVARTLELHAEWAAVQERRITQKYVNQAMAFVDDTEAFREVYREAAEAGVPAQVLDTMYRMHETREGEL